MYLGQVVTCALEDNQNKGDKGCPVELHNIQMCQERLLWHLSWDWKEVEEALGCMGEGCSKLKNSKCRSPEPRMSLVCLKNCLEASVLEGGEARVDGDEIRRVGREGAASWSLGGRTVADPTSKVSQHFPQHQLGSPCCSEFCSHSGSSHWVFKSVRESWQQNKSWLIEEALLKRKFAGDIQILPS